MKPETYKKRLATYSQKRLKNILRELVHEIVRNRDENKPCITCGRYVQNKQAGHFYNAGDYESIRYNLSNIHGQCVQCNYFKGGNENRYRMNIVKRIGQSELDMLDLKAATERRNGFHRWYNFELVEMIMNLKYNH